MLGPHGPPRISEGQVMWMEAVKDGTCQGGLVGASAYGSGGGGPCMGSHGSVYGVTWVCAGQDGLRAQVWGVRRSQETCGGLEQVGGQHGGQDMGWEAHTVGRQHIQ